MMIILLVFGYNLDLVVDLFTLSCTDNSVLCFSWDLNIALLICKTAKLICQFHVHTGTSKIWIVQTGIS